MSPLRYPGGKRRLAAFITEIIRLNGLRPKLFVEPFAGGASVALQLLNDGCVEAIALGEKDPLVASLWKIIFHDHDWLIQRIKRIKPTLKTWDYYKTKTFNNDRDRALACLYLNRTSFSGILAPGAGPIGGRSQASAYPIDCRFNPELLIRRIKQAAELKKKVLFVRQGEWRQTINAVQRKPFQPREVFYYLDPPFYEKADKLYQYYFSDKDHVALRDCLVDLDQPWVLSYDLAPRVKELYPNGSMGFKNVRLLYSARSNDELQESQELIVTNLRSLPAADRLWRSTEEWRK
jgi:DNA adenine methylase